MATIKGANKDALKSKLEEFSKQAGQKPMEGAPVGMNDLASFIDKVNLNRFEMGHFGILD